jgi:transcriptional regulator GlxA family with amidase domain
LFKNEQGLLQWFITHKYPVLDRNGHVIGIMGCIQEYRKMDPAISAGDPGILAAAEHIQEHYRDPIAIEALSRLSGMSMRQFERKFKTFFDASPREYIIRYRLRYACDALRNTRKSIAKICIDAGFYDQSSFTRQFRKYMHLTPLKYRRSAVAGI